MVDIKKGKDIVLVTMSLFSILFTSVVYSALSTSLHIDGEATVRSDNPIRITDMNILEQTDGVYETYNFKYSKDTVNIYVTLPANGSITYQINITNKDNVRYDISNITDLNNTNSNISVSSTLNENDIVGKNTTNTYTIILRNNTSSEQVGTLIRKYTFTEHIESYVAGAWGTPDSYTFVAQDNGKYKLEVWGAQGGYSSSDTSTTRGGYGAYSTGVISLSKNDTLYISVGGQGSSCNVYGSTTAGTTTCGDDGGYNGGGSTRQYVSNTYYGSGGGATHIATHSGLLNELSSYQSSILIVAGAGGGASRYEPQSISYNASGGDAGGFVGSRGIETHLDRDVTCTGGTQSAAGTGSDTSGGGLGHGGNMTRYVGPGGGSGYFGGGTSEVFSCGGSSYIGNGSLSEKSMYCYGCVENDDSSTFTVSTTGTSSNADKTNCPNGVSNTPISKCAKSGNGYAKITYLGE